MININLSTLNFNDTLLGYGVSPFLFESEFLCPLLDMHLHSCMHYGGYPSPFAVHSCSQYYICWCRISLGQTVQI